MSGFVALVERDGRPVEAELLARATAAMAYRGPDRQSTWRGGGSSAGPDIEPFVGLGHAAFDTLAPPSEEAQPADLGQRLWIVADARIDDRAALLRRLAGEGTPAASDATDARLLLHAYDTWGGAMLDQVIGDFSFVIWDTDSRRLFAARDHFGVKPLYWAEAGETLLVGNTLESLRCHPLISDQLDEHAIADFLMFGDNRHPERTSWADIHRVPPAHALSWQLGKASVAVDSYWSLRVREPLRFTCADDYVEALDEVLGTAVADRMRGEAGTVLMSGGLDSTAVAALAAERVGSINAFDLASLTFVHLHHPDDEGGLSAAAAERLGIANHRVPIDDDGVADLWGDDAAWSAEPCELPASARMVRRIAATTPGVRVGFTGLGGDPLLHVSPADAVHRARADGWMSTALAMLQYRRAFGHLPRSGLRTHLKRRLRGTRHRFEPVFPPWIDPGLVRRLNLAERFETAFSGHGNPSALRPEAERQLAGPEWSFLLEWYDAGKTGLPAEYRHPFLDRRVVELAMALPVIPWLVEKEILRRAMRRRLPQAVVGRRKAPVAGFPTHDVLLAGPPAGKGLASDDERLAQFLDVGRFRRVVQHPERLRAAEYPLITRPLSLARWLRQGPRRRVTEVIRGSGEQNAAARTIREARAARVR